MYRGRRLTFQQLTGHSVHPSRQSQRGFATGPPTQNPRSVCCAGTLGASPNSVLDELYCWLDLPANREYKIVLLQENTLDLLVRMDSRQMVSPTFRFYQA